MSRSQRILRAVAERPFPSMFDHIFQAVRAGEPEENRDKGSLRAAVSAQINQLVNAKKLRRTGTPGAYLYYATRLTKIDLRTHDEDGNPRVRRGRAPAKGKAPARKAPAREPQARPAARFVATPVRRKTAGTRPADQSFHINPPAPPPAPRSSAERESVEAFLARGGRIERLGNGDVSQPLKHIGRPAESKRSRTTHATKSARTSKTPAA